MCTSDTGVLCDADNANFPGYCIAWSSRKPGIRTGGRVSDLQSAPNKIISPRRMSEGHLKGIPFLYSCAASNKDGKKHINPPPMHKSEKRQLLQFLLPLLAPWWICLM
ncbi:hypothetical protein NQZ68_011483 [Dissostichus eleginoides]|nr:hypothetical protein NQZ68_011483 [Dissostichus eleginoides]